MPGTFVKLGAENRIEELRRTGQLFMQTLRYFKEFEEQAVRGDRLEGAAFLEYQGDGTLSVQSPDDGSWQEIRNTKNIKLHYPRNDLDELNAFCMYALSPESFPFDSKVVGFGDTALLITKPQVFLERMVAALEQANIRQRHGIVNYFDSLYTGVLTPFDKHENFSWQKEWRLVTYGGSGEPMKLKLGSLEDISTVIPSAELNNKIRVG